MYKPCGPVCEIKSKHMVGLSFQNQQLMQNFDRHNPSIFLACTVTYMCKLCRSIERSLLDSSGCVSLYIVPAKHLLSNRTAVL